jgi:hypothetical protein
MIKRLVFEPAVSSWQSIEPAVSSWQSIEPAVSSWHSISTMSYMTIHYPQPLSCPICAEQHMSHMANSTTWGRWLIREHETDEMAYSKYSDCVPLSELVSFLAVPLLKCVVLPWSVELPWRVVFPVVTFAVVTFAVVTFAVTSVVTFGVVTSKTGATYLDVNFFFFAHTWMVEYRGKKNLDVLLTV